MPSSPTVVAAWWGAGVSTIVLLWDVYKWRNRGADVSVQATANMKFLPKGPPTGNTSYISVTVANNGAQATTITHVAGVRFPSFWHRLLRRGGEHFVVLNQLPGTALPHVLAPGTQWHGVISQDDVVKKFGTSGRLYCGVLHSASKRAVYRRVRLK